MDIVLRPRPRQSAGERVLLNGAELIVFGAPDKRSFTLSAQELHFKKPEDGGNYAAQTRLDGTLPAKRANFLSLAYPGFGQALDARSLSFVLRASAFDGTGSGNDTLVADVPADGTGNIVLTADEDTLTRAWDGIVRSGLSDATSVSVKIAYTNNSGATAYLDASTLTITKTT